MSRPDVYAYLDYRAYLRDWFEARRRADPRFSKRRFARLVGRSTPGLLTEIIEGKRHLKPASVEVFARALELGPAETDFFSALVTLAAARDTRARNAAWQRISAARGFREARSVEAAGFQYLSHWYYPAIRELSYRADFVADPKWVAKALRPPIRVREAREALRTLVELQLLVDTEDGMRPVEGVITTPHEVADLSARNYHQQMLGLAHDAIERFAREERHFTAATLSVPRSLLPALKRELDALQERILDLGDTAEEAPEEVIQVNLHFFPLSDHPEEG